jgi:alkanesulfonate monooxygenase SsuD/methylene tetrahydromethanopterin reductase-like flavin-dependent oxidoreductase (luciferase family)
MVELATKAADGVVLHPFTSDRFFAASLDRVESGLAAADRARGDFSVIAGAVCGLGDAGVEGARAMVGFYGSTPAYRPVLEAEGAGDLQPELRQLTKEGRWDELPGLVDDGLLDRVAAVGDATEVASTLRRRFDRRADRLALTFASATPARPIADLVDALR